MLLLSFDGSYISNVIAPEALHINYTFYASFIACGLSVINASCELTRYNNSEKLLFLLHKDTYLIFFMRFSLLTECE